MAVEIYFKKLIYIGAKNESLQVTGTVDISIEGKKLDIPFNRIKYIELDYGNITNAQQFRTWLEENCLYEEGDTGDNFISDERIKELLSLCQEVLDNKTDASELLHDSTQKKHDYDEHYFDQVRDMANMLKDMVNSIDEQDPNAFYFSISY
jgi:hypothetical protein